MGLAFFDLLGDILKPNLVLANLIASKLGIHKGDLRGYVLAINVTKRTYIIAITIACA